jgi:hypothetical protein
MMDWDAAAFRVNAAQKGLVTVKKSLSMPLCGMGGGLGIGLQNGNATNATHRPLNMDIR